METWSLSESGISSEEASPARRYSFSNLVTMVLFAIALVAFLNAAILALAWSKKPFLGFVVEPTLVVSNVGGVSWNAQAIGMDYPERVTQIGEKLIPSGQDYLNLTEELAIGSPVGITTVFPDGTMRVYPFVRVTSFPTIDQVRFFWLPFIVGLAYMGIGLWIFRMRGEVVSSRAFALFCLSAALATGLYFDLVSTHALSILWTVAIAFLGGSLIVLGLVFPEEWARGRTSRIIRYTPYVISLGLAVWGILALTDPSNPWAYVDPWRYSYIYTSLGIFFFIGVMVYHQFAHSTPAVRQQARIVLWGSLLAFSPTVLWMLAPYLGLQIAWNPGLFLPFLIFFPIAIATAILRYRLWDIDVIINRTLVYALLTIILVLIYLATVVILQRTFQTLTGESSDLAAVVSTLVLVALFVPVRRYVQDFVDRRFYRRRYDAVKTVSSFSASLRDEVDLDRVIQRLELVLHDTIYPTHCSTWLRDEGDFRIYQPWAGITPVSDEIAQYPISHDDALIDLFRSGPGTTGLDELQVESQNLQPLIEGGYKLVVPLITQGQLIGWLGLGSRLSEQKYSFDDKVLLSRLAIQVAPTVRVAQLVAEQQAEAIERERLDQELLVASRIQTGLLPKTLPELDGWHVSAFYQPAREVGGDFYEFEYFEDGRLGIFVGDVTDKGIPAALVMATTRTLLKAAAGEVQSPGTVLARVNNLLVADIPDNMFVTCFYAIIEPAAGKMVFANAGHNLPFRLTNQEVMEIKAAGMPLGMMPDMEYDVHEMIIEPGDEMIFYSDGLVEAHNTEREMFGSQRLMNLFADFSGKEGILIDHLMDELQEFIGDDQEQEDDITIVGVKRYNNGAER
ncbi:MAG: SpoIIE family protein phosphatase [Anaerolineales bacterium]|nr:SpoIIE family protein phosphatase [Anaerolineales bacterium]